jgi:hypothetical protein
VQIDLDKQGDLKMLGLNSYPEHVQVVVFLEDEQGIEQSVDLGTIRQPLTFGDLQERLDKRGKCRLRQSIYVTSDIHLTNYIGVPKLSVLVSRPTPYDLKITSALSNFNGVSGQINLWVNDSTMTLVA